MIDFNLDIQWTNVLYSLTTHDGWDACHCENVFYIISYQITLIKMILLIKWILTSLN